MLTLDEAHMLSPRVFLDQAVFDHLRHVAIGYYNREKCTQFYIGITNNLERRRKEHEAKKPQFKWMCPIYEEPAAHMSLNGNFDSLELNAIKKFRGGIANPHLGNKIVMTCANDMPGLEPKKILYLLVG